jgi:hypothetical protein
MAANDADVRPVFTAMPVRQAGTISMIARPLVTELMHGL